MAHQTIEMELPLNNFNKVEELYHLYKQLAFGLALKILKNKESAEDATHEAFLRLLRNQTSYDPTKGAFPKWFLTVVYNICIDQIRKNSNRHLFSFEHPQIEPQINYLVDLHRPVDEQVWLKMQQINIQNALNKLPVRQREFIELAFFKGLSHSRIACLTGQPLGTVKCQIRQGLLRLKDQLDQTS